MRNKYKVNGDTVTIYLHNNYCTTVSARHLDKLLSFPGRWTLDRDYRTRVPYIKSQVMVKGKTTTTILTRFLLEPPKGKVVDHINGDTLDNTDGNLRIVTPAFNSQNRDTRSNNISGVRGIRINRHGKFTPTPMVNGKRYTLPSKATIEEAEKELLAFYDKMGIPYRRGLEDGGTAKVRAAEETPVQS